MEANDRVLRWMREANCAEGLGRHYDEERKDSYDLDFGIMCSRHRCLSLDDRIISFLPNRPPASRFAHAPLPRSAENSFRRPIRSSAG